MQALIYSDSDDRAEPQPSRKRRAGPDLPASLRVVRPAGAISLPGVRGGLPRAEGRRCDACWLPLHGSECAVCAEHPTSLTQLRSAFQYQGEVRRLVHAFKFGGESALAKALAAQLAQCYRLHGLEADAVVAVPLTGSRRRNRGYNQAGLMARELAREVELPVLEALRRRGNATPQAASATAEQRRLNVVGVFEPAARRGRGGTARAPGRRRSDDRRDVERLCRRAAIDGRKGGHRPDAGARGLMPTAGPALLVFCGGMGGSPAEDAFAAALRECALDTLTEAAATGAFAKLLLVADAASTDALSSRLPRGVEVERDASGEAFHFGRRLSDVVTRYGLERPVYVGCGLPLIKGDELASVAAELTRHEQAVVANNFFSADLIGFVPGSVVERVALPDNDRIVPRLLRDEGGLENRSLPRTIANQFDLDTPGDLAVLAYAGGAGPNLQRLIDASSIDTDRLARASRLFTDRDAEVVVAGRVGTQTWQYLETETACRVRMFAEERGLQAAGRDVNGQARSLLAFHLQSVGLQRFFEELAQLGQAAFIDTRPLFAHMGLKPSRPDRFLSDAMQPEGIEDAWVREFTAAACAAPIPVVLGGSSLVASGVQLLSEAAWRQHDHEIGVSKGGG